MKKRGADLRKGAGNRKGFLDSGEVACQECFKLRCQLDELREENKRLKVELAYREQALKPVRNAESTDEQAHTPSSRKRYKRKALAENVKRRGGAKRGHKGHGRRRVSKDESDRVVNVEAAKFCSQCEHELHAKGWRERTAFETEHLRVEKVVYRVQRSRCPKCGKLHKGQAPLLPRALYGNSLLAKMLVMHFEHGTTIGRLCQMLGEGVQIGGVIGAFHRAAKLFTPAIDTLTQVYRSSLVRHADETGWRIDGQSGWAWVFCTERVSIFHYCLTRSARIPLKILGDKPLDGVLVVDRCPAYNKAPCDLQYCYAHLLREVYQLEKEFPGSSEVSTFVAEFAPLIKSAIQLANEENSQKGFKQKADKIVSEIKRIARSPSGHLGVVDVKNIFNRKQHRLFHWGNTPDVPAHNNRAEREIRQTVIARKISFGSQSELGAASRSIIQSVITTARKNIGIDNLELWTRDVLNKLSQNPSYNIVSNIPGLSP